MTIRRIGSDPRSAAQRRSDEAILRIAEGRRADDEVAARIESGDIPRGKKGQPPPYKINAANQRTLDDFNGGWTTAGSRE